MFVYLLKIEMKRVFGTICVIVFLIFQLCGVRGGGNAAAQALFWQPHMGLSFVLAFESARERNAAIMLARRFAFDCNVSNTNPNAFVLHSTLF